MTRIDASNYDYEYAYGYRGSSGAYHWLWYIWYVPAGRSSSANQYGYRMPNERLARWNFTTRRQDCGPRSCEWTDKDTGKKYRLDASYCSGRHVWSWRELASMSIFAIHADSTAIPDSKEYVTVDVINIGGDGSFDLVLMDGVVELNRVSNVTISGGSSTRRSMEFRMLNRDMVITVKLIDKHDETVVDESTHTVRLPDPCEGVVCDPECEGTDLYTTCDDGVCIKGVLLEKDSL